MHVEEQPRDIQLQDGISEMLRLHSELDASNVQIEVKHSEVTILGFVPETKMKFMVEELIHNHPGVKEVWNLLKIKQNETISP